MKVVKRGKLGIIICPNLDGWHETDGLFIRYAMWGTFPDNHIIDEPTSKQIIALLKHYSENDRVVLYEYCNWCKRRLAKKRGA